MTVTKEQISAVLADYPDGESPAEGLVCLLDANVPSWDVAVGSERGAVLEAADGSWWAVRACDGDQEAVPCASYEIACQCLARWF